MTRHLSTKPLPWLIALCLNLVAAPGYGQNDLAAAWNGEWIAEGTLFQLRVRVQNRAITVSEVESLGFIWTSTAGEVDGNIARIPVQYAGVSGVIEVELIDSETAIAVAASCTPEFMVVCALAANRQAVFRKVQSP